MTVGDATHARDYQVRVDVNNWDLGKGRTHVHLILDNHPYKPIYDAKVPVKIGELLPAGVELTEGQHMLTAFPSRATHESVKGKDSLSVVTFWVGKRGQPTLHQTKPHLVYSRPKGENLGDMAKAVLLDFYLLNTTLANGEKVTYSLSGPGIDGSMTGAFTSWAPKVARHLLKGEYVLKLELVDKDGNLLLVYDPANVVTNASTVYDDCKLLFGQ